jgi:hypothetical protein
MSLNFHNFGVARQRKIRVTPSLSLIFSLTLSLSFPQAHRPLPPSVSSFFLFLLFSLFAFSLSFLLSLSFPLFPSFYVCLFSRVFFLCSSHSFFCLLCSGVLSLFVFSYPFLIYFFFVPPLSLSISLSMIIAFPVVLFLNAFVCPFSSSLLALPTSFLYIFVFI